MTLTRQTSIDTPASLVAAWQRAYAKRLFITDLVVIVVSVYVSQLIRFGPAGDVLSIPGEEGQAYQLSYTLVSAILALTWFVSLALFATRDHNIIGAGTVEYRRIADATIRVFAVLAIVAFLLQSEVGRLYLLVALPLGLSLLLISRWLWRKWLIRQRAAIVPAVIGSLERADRVALALEARHYRLRPVSRGPKSPWIVSGMGVALVAAALVWRS